MHELAVCQALLRQVEDVARAQRARRVTRVTVSIGALSGVEPALLAQAFPLASAGGCAQGAELHIETTDVRVRCQMCGVVSRAEPNRLLCGACGDYHTELVSGDELLLQQIELERADETAA